MLDENIPWSAVAISAKIALLNFCIRVVRGDGSRRHTTIILLIMSRMNHITVQEKINNHVRTIPGLSKYYAPTMISLINVCILVPVFDIGYVDGQLLIAHKFVGGTNP